METEGIDLIVMGTGRGVLNMVFGSVTDKVAKLVSGIHLTTIYWGAIGLLWIHAVARAMKF